MKKKIAILGITGSIGASTLEIVRHHNDRFEIVFASANNDRQRLLDIANEFQIGKVALTMNRSSQLTVASSQSIDKVNLDSTGNSAAKVYYGQDELLHLIAGEDYDILINAVSGSAGLPYTIATLERGKTLALANKESLVMAGHLVKKIVQRTGASIIPVDSEHSAIFQILSSNLLPKTNSQNSGHRTLATRHSTENWKMETGNLKYIHLTASGGPFRTIPLSDFDKIDIKAALRHPTWDMGVKVTIDSATMMNKGLEVIEAHWLFDLPYSKIKAVIHPQSVIHSIVEWADGSMIAQMSVPTMQLPILYALTHPEHIASNKVETDLVSLSALTFEEIDPQRYPLYYLACEVGRAGGLMPTILNIANERAIEKFLRSEIKFTDIYKEVEKAVQTSENVNEPDLERIMNFEL